MYVAELIVGDKHLMMSPDNGILINTIKGLNGASASLNVIPNGAGIGQAFVNGQINGVQISIQGVLLDGDVAKRREMLDIASPLAEGTLVLYDIIDHYSRRYAAYRKADVVVMQSTIAQTYHSKFVLTLYQPTPVWYEMERKRIVLNGGSQTVTVDGQAESEMLIVARGTTGALTEFTLYDDYSRYLYCDMRRYDPDGVPALTNVFVESRRGAVNVSVGSSRTPANQCLFINSTLYSIKPGEHTFAFSGTGGGACWLEYYPAYIGVALNVS